MSRWRGLAERLDESRRRGISSPALMVDTQPTLLLAGPDDSGRRLDRIVRRLLAGYPLATVYRALRIGAVRVNGKKARGEQRVAEGDEIRLDARFTAALTAPQALGEASDQTDSGVIVLERGPDLIFVSKPRGMLAHGPGGLDELCVELVGLPSSPSLAFRPAPLHRLDRNTSGIVAISASLAGALAFSRALREGRLAKYYLALLDGRLAGPESWSDTLARDGDAKRSLRAKDGAGRLARTVVTPLAATERHTLALVRIATGLTHQIRAQAGLRGHPLSGDAKYGGSRLEGGYALHAFRLELPPDLGCHAPERVVAPLPEPAQALLRRLFGSNLDTSVLSGRFEPPKEPEFG